MAKAKTWTVATDHRDSLRIIALLFTEDIPVRGDIVSIPSGDDTTMPDGQILTRTVEFKITSAYEEDHRIYVEPEDVIATGWLNKKFPLRFFQAIPAV